MQDGEKLLQNAMVSDKTNNRVFKSVVRLECLEQR